MHDFLRGSVSSSVLTGNTMRTRAQILADVPESFTYERGDQGVSGIGLALSLKLMLEVMLDIRDLIAAQTTTKPHV